MNKEQRDSFIEEIYNEIYFTGKSALMILIGGIIFIPPDESESSCRFNEIFNQLCELLAIRNYGKDKEVILDEIMNIKTAKELKTFVNSIYNKHINKKDIKALFG